MPYKWNIIMIIANIESVELKDNKYFFTIFGKQTFL